MYHNLLMSNENSIIEVTFLWHIANAANIVTYARHTIFHSIILNHLGFLHHCMVIVLIIRLKL